jgi:hypothetical protein
MYISYFFSCLIDRKHFLAIRLYNLFLLLSITILLVCSCQSNKKEASNFNLSSEERVWLTQFFEDVMLYEKGIYTLWGSKPLTRIAVEHYSDAEKQAFYNSLTEDEKKDFQPYAGGYNLDKTWFQWEKIQHHFPMNRYIFLKMDQFQEDHVFFVLFVDVIKTAAIIQDNYDAFRKVIGADFHPLELTLSLKEKNAVFWKKIEGNSHLWGILFGFGKINSHLFQWQHFDHPESCNDFCKNIGSSLSNDFIISEDSVKEPIKYTINEFPIPAFKSFNVIDPVVDNFRDERDRIKEIYKDKDFLDLTLKKLTE